MSLVLDFQRKPTEFKDLTSIENLSLRGCCEWVTDDVLDELSVSGHVRNAAFFRCWRLTDRGLSCFLSRNGKNLQRLELSGCTQLTDATLHSISRFSPGLVELDLTRCLGITDVGINFISSRTLESLLLYADSQLTSSSLFSPLSSNESHEKKNELPKHFTSREIARRCVLFRSASFDVFIFFS